MINIFSIIKKYSEFTKRQKQIVILLIILFALILVTNLLKYNNKTEWKYNDFDSVKEILYKSESVKNNRVIYWELKEIINNFLCTMEDVEFDSEYANNDTNLGDYYDVLSKEYKRKLTRKEFEEKASEFISRFLQEDHLGDKYVGYFAINDIYLFDDNKYICELCLENSEKEIGYFGVELNTQKAKFSIFYIE